MKRVIDSLTGIRAVAASWVVVLHLYELVSPVIPDPGVLLPLVLAGNLGVDFFFILSGFVISYNYAEKLARPTAAQTGRFLWLRIARIYPVHLFTLLCFGALVIASAALGVGLNSQSQYNPLSFAMNVTMLQALPPAFAWNNPAWSISAELAAYLCFPLIAVGLRRLRSRRIAVTLTAVILAAGIVALILVVRDAGSWAYWAGYVLIWIRIIVGFSVGCLVFWIWRSLGSVHDRPFMGMLVLVGAVGVVVTSFLASQTTVIVFPAFALPFLALIVFGAAGGAGLANRVLGSPVLEWGGRISYSVYMTHFVVLTVAAKALALVGLPGSEPLRMLIGILVIAAIVGIGAATYYLVEEPARRALRRVRWPLTSSRRTAGTRSPS